MKKYLLIVTASLFLFACNSQNQDKKTSSENALLAKKVSVTDWVNYSNEDNPDWTSGFDSKGFTELIFHEIFAGNFKKLHIGKKDSLTTQDVKIRMGQRSDTTYILNKKTGKPEKVVNISEINLSEIDALYFKENWDFDKNNLQMTKFVYQWSPIRTYYREDDTLKNDPKSKLVFNIKQDKSQKQGKRIAKNFTYTFKLFEGNLNRIGFDPNRFMTFIYKSIKSGKLKTYDPIYLVDKSKREFTPTELQSYAGIELDTDEPEDDIVKFIFIEDWYFDDKTFNFSKQVKGMGFVANRYGDEGWEDKILFFIFFD